MSLSHTFAVPVFFTSISLLVACGQVSPATSVSGEESKGQSSTGGSGGGSVTAGGSNGTVESTLFRAKGMACAHNGQCASGRCSADGTDEPGLCGTCLEVRRLGEACDQTKLEVCSNSASCVAGSCVTKRKSVGDACMVGPKGESSDCDDELYCGKNDTDAGPYDGAGTCKLRGVLGDACTSYPQGCFGNAPCEHGVCVAPGFAKLGEQCGARSCATGLFCEEGSGTCRPATLPLGADCGSLLGIAGCVAGTTCELTGQGNSAPYPMTCNAGHAEGESCSTGSCQTGLVCKQRNQTGDWLCASPVPAGTACSLDEECTSGLECRNGVCATACK
jgi:hypothetical protein